MKKNLFILLLMMVMLVNCIGNISLAESSNEKNIEPFNPSWFEHFDGYEYDKFDKNWAVSNCIYLSDKTTKKISGFLQIVIKGDNSSFLIGPRLAFGISNENSELERATSVEMLINDKKYSYPELGTFINNISVVEVGQKDKELFVALSEANEMSVRYHIKDYHITADIGSEDLASIRKIAIKILDIDYWNYLSDNAKENIALNEEYSPLVIEE